ncbi:Clp protease N-terminal domain-containing protein [Paramicrobacterium fandaimingii]|uniref:Clp protease N-terminal domain-containing protein n=1 Tax=Paramicrobacterium fandaimingii TaxID=2708079 RepID=UPI00189F0A6F|nr:Clp protease N-terminal domain-containing protein [Microbacterium fandaimingii]
MFEKFTTSAREIVVGAQSTARAERASQIDSRHLLLGVLDAGGETASTIIDAIPDAAAALNRIRHANAPSGLDAEALASIGIDISGVTARADDVFGEGALQNAGTTKRHIPFRNEAKKVLELALREAIRLNEKSIGARHILLGILRARGTAYDALVAEGVDVGALRASLDGLAAA